MPRHIPHMIEHPRQNLNNALPLSGTHVARIMVHDEVKATLYGSDLESLKGRARTFAAMQGWRSAQVVTQ